MTKEEVALELTLEIMERIEHTLSKTGRYGLEESDELSKIAIKTYNDIYNGLEIKKQLKYNLLSQ